MGVKLSYNIFTPAKRSYGFPVYILHGLLCTKNDWSRVAERLCSHGIEVVSIDARNHGESEYTEEIDCELMRRDLEKLRIDLGHDKISILGHSMGGLVAFVYSLQHTDVLEDLIIVDITPFYTENGKIAALLNILIEIEPRLNKFSSESPIDDVIGHVLPNHNSGIRNANLERFLRSNILVTPKTNRYSLNFNIHSLRRFYENAPSSELNFMGIFEGRVLFIGGVKSQMMSPEKVERLEEYFPNSIVVYMENCGHSPYKEDLEGFIGHIKEFLI